MGHIFNKEILKPGDIRGIYGTELTAEDYYWFGRTFATYLITKNGISCIVGRDGRLSSPEASQALIKGLVESGIQVIDLGLVSSPCLYYSVSSLHADGGLMVTASHNPPAYNGLKFVLQGRNFLEKDIAGLARTAAEDSCLQLQRQGTVTEGKREKEAYLSHLLAEADKKTFAGKRIVWDPGNGAALFILKSFLSQMPGDHYLICDTIDGSFPNHAPDPSKPENLVLLGKTVRGQQANLGVAFDGDADRIAIVDEDGQPLSGIQLLLLLAGPYLDRHPGYKVQSEVKASRIFLDGIKELGGIPLLTKVGRVNQQIHMRETDVGLAAETSGHVYFKENNYEDDGLFAALEVLKALQFWHISLSDFRKKYPMPINSGEIRLPMQEKDRKILLDSIRRHADETTGHLLLVDGIRWDNEKGFFLIRSSNTEPHMTIYAEGKDEVSYIWICKKLIQSINATGYDGNVLYGKFGFQFSDHMKPKLT
ncbi:MAG: phosphomannomutase/phosphoglucomutase [Spirochaetia bacterium]|jgi:phosphomannomutase|nr:phosphomannomutase/phosphoglucomutase [Spirochaetia bacterium]